MRKRNKENGTIMLEATFCILVCIVVIMLLLSTGFFLYQKVMISVVANEVAENVTQTYKLLSAEDSSDISLEDVENVCIYRYYFFSSIYRKSNEKKGRAYANIRLSKTSLAQDDGTIPVVTIEQVHDDIGRFHYEITVKQHYTFLWGELLEWIGIPGSQEMTATAYAEGVDIFHYVNTVKTYKYFSNKALQTSLGKVLNSGVKVIKSIYNLFKP